MILFFPLSTVLSQLLLSAFCFEMHSCRLISALTDADLYSFIDLYPFVETLTDVDLHSLTGIHVLTATAISWSANCLCVIIISPMGLSSDDSLWPWPRFVAQWGVLMLPKNRYGMTPGVRHSGIVNWLIHLFIYSFTHILYLNTPCYYNVWIQIRRWNHADLRN